MEEQRLVVPKEEEEGTENGGRDPLIVQVRTLGDFLTRDGTSHLKPESKDEMHQCWDSQWQEFLKSVAGLPIAPPPLEENSADSQASLGRDEEDPQEESSGEARGKYVLQKDPSIDRKAWMGKEKLDSSVKVKVEEIQEEVNLESQAPLPLRQFSFQDAEEHQEVSSTQIPKKAGKWIGRQYGKRVANSHQNVTSQLHNCRGQIVSVLVPVKNTSISIMVSEHKILGIS